MAGRRKISVPISTARAKLFSLTDMVREAGDDTVVVFEQRGQREQVALVRESRLAYLEARVAEFEMRQQKQTPFTLAGSLSTPLDEDALEQALDAIRKEWSPPAAPDTPSTPPTVTRTRRRP